MTVTVLAEYAVGAQTSHTITFTATPGRPVLVWAAAAAAMSAAPAGWVRDVYRVNFTAGAVYRLPAAANTGAVTSLQIDLTGGGNPAARALSAVVVELDADGEPRVDFDAYQGYTASDVQSWAGSVPAAGAGESTITGAMLCSGTFYVALIPAVASWASPLVEVADSGTLIATNEDARVSVATTDGAFSGTLSLTYASSWNAAGVGAVYRYTPGGTIDAPGVAELGGLTGQAVGVVGAVGAGTAPLGGLAGAAVGRTSVPRAAVAQLGGLTARAAAVVPTAGILTATLRTTGTIVASLTGADDMLTATLGGDASMADTLRRSWLSREPVVWALGLADGGDFDPSAVEVAFVPDGTDLDPDDAAWTTVTGAGLGTAEVTVSVLVGPTGDTTADVQLGRGLYDAYIRPTYGDQAPVRTGRLHLD